MEAYILVHRAGFSMSDVRDLTRTERSIFLGFLEEELKREQDAIKQFDSH